MPTSPPPSAANADPQGQPSQRRSRWASWLERTLWTVSLLCLGIAGWSWADARLYQMRTRELVAAVEQLEKASVPGAGDSAESVEPAASEGTPIALLEIPRLGLSAVVAEGTSKRVLSRAVGHLPESARPGGSGNIALAAHRDSFFRPLEQIQTGDLVILESAAGRDRYVVEWTDIVGPRDVEMVDATAYPALTLVTCYPFRYVGNAPQRFIVRARLLDEEGARATRQTTGDAATEPATG